MARRVVAQASFSWPFGPIHLLAPYGAVSHTKGWAADLTGHLRQRLTALPPPLEGEAGWVVQVASVVTHSPLRCGSFPPESQSEAGVPHSGVAAIPLHIATASGWKPFGGTTPLRAQRVLKGKGLIRKKGKTAGVPLLVRSAAAQAAFPPVMRGQFRNAFQGDTPAYGNGRPPRLTGSIPYNDLSVSA